MPFTFAHPALILPLQKIHKKYISMTGLVIGSMSPDFEYFIRMKIQSSFSHTISGIFFFDLPISLLVCFLFHTIIKNDLINNMPDGLTGRFQNLKLLNWNEYFRNNWVIVFISIVAGIFSHIFWDSFTHKGGFFADRIYFLNHVWKVENFDIPGYKIAQHISTLAGFIFISITIYLLPEREIQRRESGKRAIYWACVFLITLLTVFVRLIFVKANPGILIVSVITGILLALILSPFIIKK